MPWPLPVRRDRRAAGERQSGFGTREQMREVPTVRQPTANGESVDVLLQPGAEAYAKRKEVSHNNIMLSLVVTFV